MWYVYYSQVVFVIRTVERRSCCASVSRNNFVLGFKLVFFIFCWIWIFTWFSTSFSFEEKTDSTMSRISVLKKLNKNFVLMMIQT